MGVAQVATVPASESRGWLGTLGVFVVMIGVVGSGLYAQGLVADIPNSPIDVASGVSVLPPPGWEFAGRAEDENTIVLSRGNGSLAVSVVDGTDERATLTALRDEWTASGTVSTADIRDATGVHGSSPAATFAYSGTFGDIAGAVEGEVTGIRGTSVVVVFDGWADVGDYASVSDEIAGVISGATIP